MQIPVLEILRCPNCGGRLRWTVDVREGERVDAADGACDADGRRFEVRDGIAVLLPRGSRDPWREMVSGLERILRDHPAAEAALVARDPRGLRPADQFLRVQLFEARGRFREAEAEQQAANAAVYGHVFANAVAQAIDALADRLRDGDGAILDVASGRGTLVQAHLRRGRRIIVATDVSPWILRRLREKALAVGLPAERLCLVACDARRLPFATDAFADLTTFEGLANIAAQAADDRRAPRAAARVLLEEWRRVAFRMHTVQSQYPAWDLFHRAVLARVGISPLVLPGPFRRLLRESGWRVTAESGRSVVRRPTPRSRLVPGLAIDMLPVVPTRLRLEVLLAERI